MSSAMDTNALHSFTIACRARQVCFQTHSQRYNPAYSALFLCVWVAASMPQWRKSVSESIAVAGFLTLCSYPLDGLLLEFVIELSMSVFVYHNASLLVLVLVLYWCCIGVGTGIGTGIGVLLYNEVFGYQRQLYYPQPLILWFYTKPHTIKCSITVTFLLSTRNNTLHRQNSFTERTAAQGSRVNGFFRNG